MRRASHRFTVASTSALLATNAHVRPINKRDRREEKLIRTAQETSGKLRVILPVVGRADTATCSRRRTQFLGRSDDSTITEVSEAADGVTIGFSAVLQRFRQMCT